MTPLHALVRRVWPLLDWRRGAVLESRRRRGAAAMLDESMRRTALHDEAMRRAYGVLSLPYRLGDSDGTWPQEPGDVTRNVEPCPMLWTCADGGKLDCGGCNGDGTRTVGASRGRAAYALDLGRHPLLEPSDGEAVPPPTLVPCGPACDIHTVRPGSSQCNFTDPACPNSGQFPPPTTRTVPRETLMRRAREAAEGSADYLPPWTGEGL